MGGPLYYNPVQVFEQNRDIDNFLEVGGLKTAQVKFLHYHTHFCMTTPLIIVFAKKSGGA